MLSVACESDITRVGVGVDANGTPLAFYKACKAATKIRGVRLVSFEQGKQVVWEIVSRDGSSVRAFVAGQSPTEFAEVTAYHGTDLSNQMQFQVDADDMHEWQSFDIARLSPGKILVDGKLMSPEEFDSRNVCP